MAATHIPYIECEFIYFIVLMVPCFSPFIIIQKTHILQNIKHRDEKSANQL